MRKTLSLQNFWNDALAVPVNLKKKLATNMPQFIERTNFNSYKKNFI